MTGAPYEQLIASRLKSARKLTGLSQKELAARLNISAQQIQKYESGENRISAGRLWQVAELLSLTPSYFFRDGAGMRENARPAPPADERTNAGDRPTQARHIAALLEKIDDQEVIDAILLVIESYLASRGKT